MNRADKKAKLYELEKLVLADGPEEEIYKLREELNMIPEVTKPRKKYDFNLDRYLQLQGQRKNDRDIASIMGMTYSALLKNKKKHGLCKNQQKSMK